MTDRTGTELLDAPHPNHHVYIEDVQGGYVGRHREHFTRDRGSNADIAWWCDGTEADLYIGRHRATEPLTYSEANAERDARERLRSFIQTTRADSIAESVAAWNATHAVPFGFIQTKPAA